MQSPKQPKVSIMEGEQRAIGYIAGRQINFDVYPRLPD
jgi:hypothetical protein